MRGTHELWQGILQDAGKGSQNRKRETHTPAPWSAFTDESGRRPHTNIVGVVPITDCVFSLPGHHKREANVQLICAAPDMHSALSQVLNDPAWDNLSAETKQAVAKALIRAEAL